LPKYQVLNFSKIFFHNRFYTLENISSEISIKNAQCLDKKILKRIWAQYIRPTLYIFNSNKPFLSKVETFSTSCSSGLVFTGLNSSQTFSCLVIVSNTNYNLASTLTLGYSFCYVTNSAQLPSTTYN
jgi:hypothetical protein